MLVRTHGINQRLTKKELRDATKFMSGLLMSKRLCKNITIHIYSVEGPPILDGSKCKAYMIPWDSRPHRSFRIYIDSTRNKREQLHTLGHEITHVKQYAKGEVKDITNVLAIWKNEEHSLECEKDKIDYFFRPWEVESFGYERGLYKKYIQHVKRRNKK